MLVQSLSLIAIMLVLTASLLATALLTAKASLQQAVTRHLTAALTRGGNEATNWAQRYVAVNGAAATWPATTQTDSPRLICAAQSPTSASPATPGAPTPGAPATTGDPQPCHLVETTTYAVVGSTAATTAANAAAAPDRATNLQQGVNENRVALVVTATIRNRADIVLGSRSRRLTLRVFDAPPFAVVTGAEDSASTNGPITATQGDTGGYDDKTYLLQSEPNASNPSRVKDTRIHVVISCANSPSNNNQSDAFANNHAPGNNRTSWGVKDPGFESPCQPTYTPAPAYPVPTDYYSSHTADYFVPDVENERKWSNRLLDENARRGWPSY